MIEAKRWQNFYLIENREVQQSNHMNMSMNVDDIPEGKSQIKAKVVELLEVVSMSKGNSVVSRGIWGKYSEWYFKVNQIITNWTPKRWALKHHEPVFWKATKKPSIYWYFFIYTTMGTVIFTCITKLIW